MTDTNPRYVFIVGLPRTGTKLLMNVLENCPHQPCYITPENFFLGRFLRPGVREVMHNIGDFTNDDNVSRLVEQIYAGDYSVFKGDYWWLAQQGQLKMDQAAMTEKILASDRSDRAIYQVILESGPGQGAGMLLGDKTGPHLYRVPTLLAWFPEAKVIHTFRDPRAILASEHKKQLARLDDDLRSARKADDSLRALGLQFKKVLTSLVVVLYITVAWSAAARLDKKYRRQYPDHYRRSRFEDLVQRPEEHVRALCHFLEIEFDPAMLNPPQVDSSFGPKGGNGFSQQTLNRWQSYLKPWMKLWLWAWSRKYLREFGYLQ